MIDRADVRMVQRCQHESFALESRHAFRIAREGFGQDLDRHLSRVKRGIAGAIDFTHSANSQKFQDFVRADLRAGFECHRVRTDYTFYDLPIKPAVCGVMRREQPRYFPLKVLVPVAGVFEKCSRAEASCSSAASKILRMFWKCVVSICCLYGTLSLRIADGESGEFLCRRGL